MVHVVMVDSPETLKVLLDLADRPKDVQTTTDYETLAVVVPDELYERYEQYQSLSESSSPKEPKKRVKRKVQLPGQE